MCPKDGWTWGATGHEWVSGIAIEKLPGKVAAFVRTPGAAAEIAVLGRELDRSKGAGKEHDSERDPGHYVDLGDNSDVIGVLPLNELPDSREQYYTLLRERIHPVQGWQLAILDHRRLAAAPERLRVLAVAEKGARDCNDARWLVLHPARTR